MMHRAGHGVSQPLILWDIDGTILHCLRAHLRALDRTCQALWGFRPKPLGRRAAGGTDLQVFRLLLADAGLPPSLADGAEVMATWAAALRDEVQRDPGWVLPGVSALLARLYAAGIPLALATGNAAAAAYAKLAVHDLAGYFPVGGFGDGTVERAELVAAALQQAAAHYALPAGDGAGPPPLLVGDTPRDAAAAAANGCIPVGVATGAFRAAELRAAGCAVVFDSFAEVEQAFEDLLALARRPAPTLKTTRRNA